MIGLTYKKYFPKEVLRSSIRLFVSDSPFISEDGTIGVIDGPCFKFTEVQNEGQLLGTINIFSHFAHTVDRIRSVVPSDFNRAEMYAVKADIRTEGDSYSSEDELDTSTQLS